MPHLDTYTYTDPRELDGDVFTVASLAIGQADRAVRLAVKAVSDADIMARGAEMERQIYATGEADAPAWPEHPQAKAFLAALASLGQVSAKLTMLQAAASYNPKHPPKES